MSKDLTASLTALLEDAAAAHGLELVAVEITGQGGSRMVRVYLDQQGGIDIDTIVAANAWISDALDSCDDLAGAYTLEVSSPGIERPLRKPADYERFTGRHVALKVASPIDGRRSFSGMLAGLDGDQVILKTDTTRLSIPLASITKAHLKFDFASIDEGKTR
ncbi:MAG: ribosome maturation factor RimP [Coriobacteriales bacterium]|nr:ribosome maturation factor RimP [Actinomycetes bacterium]